MNSLMLNPLINSVEYNDLISILKSKNVILNGLLKSQKSHIAYLLNQKLDKQMLYICSNVLEAKKVYEDLKFYNNENVEYLGYEDILFYHLDAKDRSIEAKKIKTLSRLLRKEKIILVTSVEAILKKYVPKEILIKNTNKFKVSENIDIEEFTQNLIRLGYERVSKVEGFGQFSVRGGIIDIFSLEYEKPVRIELFDDEIESIRIFDIYSQKSVENLESAVITPSREFIYPLNTTSAVIDLKSDSTDLTKEEVFRDIDNIEYRTYFEGIENYIDYIYKDCDKSLFNYLEEDAFIFFEDISRTKERIENYRNEFTQNYQLNLERGTTLKNQGNLIYDYSEFEYLIQGRKIILNSILKSNIKDFKINKNIDFDVREVAKFNGKLDLLIEEIKRFKSQDYKILLGTNSLDRAKKLSDELFDAKIDNTVIENDDYDIKNSQVIISPVRINQGFEYKSIKFIVITDNEMIGLNKTITKSKINKGKKSKKIESFLELNIGDYVVHESSGVGRYTGVEQITINNIKRDYLKVVYQGGDNLYLPIDQMDKIQKYIGVDDEKVKINKLGSAEWLKAKNKVKKEIEDMTKDLIDLYAKRNKVKGFKFSEDTAWQSEFEEMFPHQETNDQLTAIQDTKIDMESNKVMDRLICGDVGYGKTEVAIRAIFKACMDSKQVAVLVPTTILAQQHYNTFKERFEQYGLRVEVISRLKTTAQQQKIIRDTEKGSVDVLIGTHRIISKDISIPKLGLVVIDEEQRFGVRHKEALKKIKSEIDVLTLSATPIPRTLHMSLSGIRDMSVIEEPPQERHPVITYVTEAKDSIIQDEIEREISRDGQVFFVYNRVETIDHMANRINKLVPDAKVAVAHGRMTPKDLENIILGFLNKKYNVLVCTTIIETGMDISNANTMIIYDADKMGLSQLYQLRGRVGRSKRQGYAYLMYEKEKTLSEVAEKRLKAIKEFTEFGSGFKIAMRDLEIRGAGSVLGAKQHGHMSIIGYDLYVKMLNEAIRKVKGEDIVEEVDVEIDIPVNAYIPNSYIEDEVVKIDMYKKISYINSKEDIKQISEELEDRFSDIPLSVKTLLKIAYIKSLCKILRIEKVRQIKDEIILAPLTRYKTKEKMGSKVVFELEELLENMIKLKKIK
ncbi:MAG: transcription-repair coupling factor [Peptostreptococcaceae bacterium]